MTSKNTSNGKYENIASGQGLSTSNSLNIVYITDNVELMKKADEIIFLQDGSIIQQGQFGDLIKNTKLPFYINFCLQDKYKNKDIKKYQKIRKM